MQMGNNINNNNMQNNNQRSLSNPAGGMTMGHNQLQQQLQQPPQQQTRNDTLAQLDLSSDLNFDPAAVIDGGGEGQEGLNVNFKWLIKFLLNIN